ncbi:MAG: M48 family metalloprotease [Cytophagales bacterium]|nr:M48 family metalloprotease [Cytophagales bacterium]
MKTIKPAILFLILLSTVLFVSCDKNGNFLLFSVQNDIDLGAQVADEIASDPTQFPILPRINTTNCPHCFDAYAYLDNMVDAILSSQDVAYRNEFAWEVHLIDNDEILNAFATPGGYIYVYTGLIKFLEQADDLAGVLGHEIAHADQRHSSKQLQRQYGVSILLSIILGEEPGQLTEVAGTLAGTLGTLSFSRSLESEADEYSVIYLSETDYACNGAFSFFQKLIDLEQTGGTPEFLSTHPDPSTRVEAINEKASEIGCSTEVISESSPTYDNFRFDLLPD